MVNCEVVCDVMSIWPSCTASSCDRSVPSAEEAWISISSAILCFSRRIFGISRAHLYRLAADGLVRSACIKQQPALRGRRLWHIPSIRALLESNIQRSGI